jgi:hypothetical protein
MAKVITCGVQITLGGLDLPRAIPNFMASVLFFAIDGIAASRKTLFND